MVRVHAPVGGTACRARTAKRAVPVALVLRLQPV
jgi:hypothetical protein